MAPKGDGIVEWTDELEKLIQHTGVGWDGPTNTVKANPDIWDKFIKPWQRAIDLAEGSGDSDDPTDEAEEPVVTGSRRRVRKRGSNNKSQLQELIDLYKESKVKKDKAKNSTPPESKKSKSVTSPEKPAQNSIEKPCSSSSMEEDYGKHCIGAIDETHVKAIMPASVRGAYRDRNGDITQNVLAVCSHQMIFTYVMTGWEGSAHDFRILSDAATLPTFPAPQGGGMKVKADRDESSPYAAMLACTGCFLSAARYYLL
ncbi:uncharacterized protein LOC116202992 [Punica granatum]|uniref:Uncharacterized protein LOC116202992 n=1 Tax=Punica granatum TaxID=22663 RepID=A0A6P8D275_PUNGR|nr:uncharacterized protein LOC116202992 [Punica granatum]